MCHIKNYSNATIIIITTIAVAMNVQTSISILTHSFSRRRCVRQWLEYHSRYDMFHGVWPVSNLGGECVAHNTYAARAICSVLQKNKCVYDEYSLSWTICQLRVPRELCRRHRRPVKSMRLCVCRALCDFLSSYSNKLLLFLFVYLWGITQQLI